MSTLHPIRVLIADDQAISREGLAAILTRGGDIAVVGEARDGADLVDQHARLVPDVTITELRIAGASSIDAIRSIKARCPSARVLILSRSGSEEDIHRGLRAGAQGYVLKTTSRDELITAVRNVSAGRSHLDAQASEALARHMSTAELTRREREVLAHMAEGQANKDIAGALFITPGSVKAHVHNILGKLGASDRTHAVTLALRRGLVQFD